jgi:hypothetical protein
MIKTIMFTILIVSLSTRILGQVDEGMIRINDTIQLKLYRTEFEPNDKLIEYHLNNLPYAIDGKPLFGSFGELPKYQLSRAVLSVGQKVYELQVENMYNPWFGKEPSTKLFHVHKYGAGIQLRAIFSDGAGAYGAEWLIIGNSCIRTILTDDERIIVGYISKKE